MSALAHILRQLGHTVTGSDQSESETLSRLQHEGLHVWAPHDPRKLAQPSLVAKSVAIREDNPELLALIDRGLPIGSRADYMEALGRLRRTIAVSGTAGKTTTSAMIATIATQAGWNPSMIVGATVHGLGTGVSWHESDWFVVEADESDGSFLRFRAEAVVVNSIEADHLDYWESMANLESGFDRFVGQASGPRLVCADDLGCQELLTRMQNERVLTFGFAAASTYRIVEFAAHELLSTFDVLGPNGMTVSVRLQVPGRHNARNATAALAVMVELGVSPDVAAAALAEFRGAARRYEYRGTANGVTFVDDYAHLPAKVRAAVDAALLGGWSRVLAIYQPHRFTRTRDLWQDHAHSFEGVDVLVVTDIYPAGQDPIDGVSAELIVEAVRSAHPNQRVEYVVGRAALVDFLERELMAGDLCLTMNAGDLTTLPTEMLATTWARP